MLYYLFYLLFFIHHPVQDTVLKPAPIRFDAQTIDSNVAIGYGLALGDVDGDGKPDILLADKKQFVWYRNGDWKRFVMVDSLTKHDNVCIAARDIDGDGKVEVAVGAQWNPGETGDAQESGSVHYLVRPADPTQPWKAVKLHHEPTVHRMQWMRRGKESYFLVVVPLHGRNNKDGEGAGVKILAYHVPKQLYGSWKVDTLDKTMHLTHNFDIVETNTTATLYLAGKEGVKLLQKDFNNPGNTLQKEPVIKSAVGEVRRGKLNAKDFFMATVEPMHGDKLVVYPNASAEGIVIDDNIKEGHALAVADLFNAGSDQVILGWRVPNKDNKVGIKLYVPKNGNGSQWDAYWIDENDMACEDLKVMDLNGDGRPDIVASGRATHNLKIYWNKR